MKRLIAQIGLTYLSILAVVFYFGKTCAYVIGVVSLVAMVLFLAFERSRKTIYLPCVAFVALLACVVNLCYTSFVYDKVVDKYNGYDGEITATLIEEPVQHYGMYQYEFETKTIGETDDNVKLSLLYNELLAIEPFDVVEINVSLSFTDNEQLLSQKCFLTASFDYEKPQYSIIGKERFRVYRLALWLRQAVREALREALDEDSFKLCSALLIGDKYALGDDIYQMFVRAGVSHLIVVSGLHFSILSVLFLKIARRFYRFRHLPVIFCVLFLLIYMAVTGYTPSVVRSGVMMLIYCLGVSLSRETYSLNSLGLAAIILTAFNPYSVGDVGMILSFASVFAMILFAPSLKAEFLKRIKFKKCKSENRFVKFAVRTYNRLKRGAVELLSVNISVFVVSLPLSIVFFGATSIVSMVATFVLYLPIWALLYLTLFLALIYYIPFVTAVLTPMLAFCIEIVAHFSLWVVKLFASIPFAYLTVKNNFVYVWLLMYVVMLCMFLMCRCKTVAVKAFACSSLAVFLAGYVVSGVLSAKVSTIDVFDVGNGTAVMYSDSMITAVIELDCNRKNAYNTVRKIERKTSHVDFISSISDDVASVNSLYSLTKVFAISDVLLYDTRRSVELPDSVENVLKPGENFTVEFSDNAKADYFLTEEGYIIYLSTAQSTTLILPAYIDVFNIPDSYRKADYIVVNNSPLNSELLICDTLIVSADESCAKNIMKFTDICFNRALLTADKDIEIVEVV